MTASGVMIKVPARPVADNAKPSSTLTMANGVRIKMGKADREAAQRGLPRKIGGGVVSACELGAGAAKKTGGGGGTGAAKKR